MTCKTISGLTPNTASNILIDAGVFFKNYVYATDTIETAIADGKLIGATKGGGGFSSVPTFREIEVDGARGRIKELKQIESVETKMSANIVEVTVDTLRMALAATEVDTTDTNHTKISGKWCIDGDDFTDNITWIGNQTDGKLVVIQIFNGLNENGLELSFEDKGEGVIALELFAHQSLADMSAPPYAIYYPNIVQTGMELKKAKATAVSYLKAFADYENTPVAKQPAVKTAINNGVTAINAAATTAIVQTALVAAVGSVTSAKE